MAGTQDAKLTMSKAEGYAALAAAGIKVWRSEDGKKTRVYEPGREGAYMVLEAGFRDAEWSDYPQAKAGKDSARLSGGFCAEVRDALAAARKAAVAKVIS